MTRRGFIYIFILLSTLTFARTAHAAIASVTNSEGYSQWVVANSSAHLDMLIQEIHQQYGGAPWQVDIRCNGPGWVAYYFSSSTQADGYACGFSTAAAADSAAHQECTSHGGTNCYRVHLRYDSGRYEMNENDSNPIYHLRRTK